MAYNKNKKAEEKNEQPQGYVVYPDGSVFWGMNIRKHGVLGVFVNEYHAVSYRYEVFSSLTIVYNRIKGQS
jgi:hypothetical protein